MIQWTWQHFDSLTTAELHAIFRLRAEVFVVEQDCVYQDVDGLDPQCWHLQGNKGGELGAYARILSPNLIHELPSIGRVVTAPTWRGGGLGKSLMIRAMELCIHLFGDKGIYLGGQSYLGDFYKALGFEQGSAYVEDGIPHHHMTRPGGSPLPAPKH